MEGIRVESYIVVVVAGSAVQSHGLSAQCPPCAGWPISWDTETPSKAHGSHCGLARHSSMECLNGEDRLAW